MKILVASLVTVALLTACESEVRDIGFFKANEAERIEVIKRCDANPGALRDTPDCVNAIAAHGQLVAEEIQARREKRRAERM